MIPADPLPNEEERLAELLRYDIMDTLPEEDFNEIVELASVLCEAEISLISLIDDHRQWFKAKTGLDAEETPKEFAFCAHAIHYDGIFQVPDATKDGRFFDNPLVTGAPDIRFYAGQSICSADGHKFGTLCVIDRYPRQLTEKQQNALQILARQVERQLELRLRLNELKQSFKVIASQKDSLEIMNKLKDETLSVLCHDLRSPLASIHSVLELFEHEGLEAEDLVELIRNIKPLIDKGSHQLNYTLNWARKQLQGGEVELNSVNLDQVADLSLDWVRENAAFKGVNLIKKVAPKVTVLANQDLLEIVLRNLLANAVKYTRKGDNIILFTQEKSGWICVGVKDSGLGIKPEDLPKIIEKNYHFSTEGTAREKGTGLGLILCQNYLRKMKTKLQVKSVWGQGCVFFFLLPKC
jgi:signal transduction histidine kinase